MSFLLSILGGLIGLLLAALIIFSIIYFRVRSIVGKSQMKEITKAIADAPNIQKENYSREKHVVGMTNLLEPRILHDFPEFNRELLFSLCERNLVKILNCIEEKSTASIQGDTDFIYIEPKVREKIKDMNTNKIEEKYDNIEFNRNAISSYIKENGKATIKVSTSLGYYYKTNRKDKKCYTDVKKQTRYTSEFVYVYDESKLGYNQVSFSIHCKNCGAPIRNLGNSFCEYCMTPVDRINLKAWKMTSYKEDYN